VVDIALKRRWNNARLEAAGIDPDDRLKQVVRVHDNGWVFARNDMAVTDPWVFRDIVEASTPIIDWGCVDVLIDTESKEWHIVEVNSAPGMSDDRTRHAIRDNLVRKAMEVFNA
jgi:hypothetical protein